jgi:hypothetical protein
LQLYLYSVDHGRIAAAFNAHDDAVSAVASASAAASMAVSPLIVSGSWDSTVKVCELR